MDARYQGHGDLDLTKDERSTLQANGFEPHGNHAWVRFAGGEFGGTCYDDRWAMAEATANPQEANGA